MKILATQFKIHFSTYRLENALIVFESFRQILSGSIKANIRLVKKILSGFSPLLKLYYLYIFNFFLNFGISEVYAIQINKYLHETLDPRINMHLDPHFALIFFPLL
jgi:hypothetical protein